MPDHLSFCWKLCCISPQLLTADNQHKPIKQLEIKDRMQKRASFKKVTDWDHTN